MLTTRIAILIGALLVLALAGCGGADTSDDTDASGDTGAQGATGTVEVEARDLAFEPVQLSAAAGDVKVTMNNTGAVEHNLIVEEAGDTEVTRAGPGDTAEGTIALEAGTYTYYCNIPGHREAGMEGILEVK